MSEILAPYDIRLREEWARRRKNRQLLRNATRVLVLLAVDSLALLLAYLAAVALRQEVLPGMIAGLQPLALPTSFYLLPAALAIHLLSLAAFRAYSPGRSRRDYYQISLGILVGTLLLFFGAPIYVASVPSRLLFTLAGVSAICSVVSLRWLLDKAVIAYRRQNQLGQAALVVGHADHTAWVRSHFDQTPEANIRFVESLTFEEVEVPARVGAAEEPLTSQLLSRDIEVVVVAGDPPKGMAKGLFERCLRAGCRVFLVPSVVHEIANPVTVEDLSGLSALVVMRPRLALPQLAMKRVFDFTVSLLGLLALGPLFGAIAIAVKIDSRGPVYFRQYRVGVGGRLFLIYKFRTMVADAEERKDNFEHLNQYKDGKFFKIKNDPRITRVGHFLRRTSLDELPQLINVLRGEMSLVGPRPPVPEEVADYEERHLQRLSVTPGITGLWQVTGRSEVLDFEEVVRLDLEYINTWSLWRDLAILVKTLPVVFRTNGAA